MRGDLGADYRSSADARRYVDVSILLMASDLLSVVQDAGANIDYDFCDTW